MSAKGVDKHAINVHYYSSSYYYYYMLLRLSDSSFTQRVLNIYRYRVLTALFACYMAGDA